MTKTLSLYICQNCGASAKKWAGKCESCDGWNTLQEEHMDGGAGPRDLKSGASLELLGLDAVIIERPRVSTSLIELDRVLGGGLVPASAILLGGDPGIGKSTILLQLASRLSKAGHNIVYVTGEESIEQVSLRARRMGLEGSPVKMLAATNVADILATIRKVKPLTLVIIDSIQTMFVNDYNSAPGTVSQVRAAAFELINYAKKNGVALVLVGHVTKDGQIAGPKVLEHMVDTVLYFEGERGHHFRILRAVKNRFGGVNEIGVFAMGEVGLEEVLNPSALFLSNHQKSVSGSVVFAGVEGTRPILVEVQALIAKSMMPTPRRAVVGWDVNRLAMILAVLGSRYGVFFGDKEVYLNIAGGLKINEPAADLAVAAALLTSFSNKPMEANTIVAGEIGLAGEVRMINQLDARLKEAEKLGFKRAIIPKGAKLKSYDLEIVEIQHVRQLEDFC